MAVFIDADNLNDATALDHVLTDLRQRADRVLYKRAYGRVDSLKAIESVLWRHGVRPVSNMIVNKVTTDSALVIDAVEAVCTQEIDTVAICSGDADFVPLATWVRERGCHVLCFSLSNKIFANPESFYDEVILLEVVEKLESPAACEPVKIVQALAAAAPHAEPGTHAKVQGEGITQAAVSAAGLQVSTSQSPSRDLIERVLRAVPSLRSGQSQHLGQVVAALRHAGLLGKATKTTVWFAQFEGSFKLQPAQKPNQIAYVTGSLTTNASKAAGEALPGVCTKPSHEMAQRVLKAVPDLRNGPQVLSQIVPVLRQKTILGKTTKSTTFFAKLPSHFKLSPKAQPTHVAYVGPRSPDGDQ